MNYDFFTIQRGLDSDHPALVTTKLNQNETHQVIIIRDYEKEQSILSEDIDKLVSAFPEIKAAIESGGTLIKELTLQEISAVVPRQRVRIDSYARLVRLLLTKGIELKITSRKTRLNPNLNLYI